MPSTAALKWISIPINNHVKCSFRSNDYIVRRTRRAYVVSEVLFVGRNYPCLCVEIGGS